MKVFISYISRDGRIAEALAQELNRKDIQVLSASTSAGPGRDDLYKAIRSFVQSADAMIALVSKHSYSSSIIREEIDEALFNERFKGKFLPVIITDGEEELPRMPWVLRSIEHLQVSKELPVEKIAQAITAKFWALIKEGR